MFKWVWKEVEDKTGKARIAKAVREGRKEGEEIKRKEGKFRRLIVEIEMKIARVIEEK